MSDFAEPLPLPPGREALVAVHLCDLANIWAHSTELAAEVLNLYEPLSETMREDHGGRALPTAGDRELLAFPTVDAALVWALRMQEALLAADWPSDYTGNCFVKDPTECTGGSMQSGLVDQTRTPIGERARAPPRSIVPRARAC